MRPPRYRASLSCLLFAAAAPLAAASTRGEVVELTDARTTNVRRDALVAALSAAPFREVAPGMPALLREYATPAEPGMGPRPWLEDGHSVRARIWYALGAIWQSHLAGSPDPGKAAVLLSMLETSSHAPDRSEVIAAIGHHWTPDAERRLAAVLDRRSEAAEVRVAAARELLRRASIDRHVPAAVTLVRELPSSRRVDAYRDLADLGDSVRSARPDSRASLVDLGFELLDEDTNPHERYVLATTVGLLLDAPGAFAPDGRDPQYQGPNGRTQEFFEQTVRNALAWRATHPRR